ncbi:MAG: hypothetical protein WKG01_22205 [Kofleriaceae bacterium]
MSRAKTQRPRTRSGTQSENSEPRRAATAASREPDPPDPIDQLALDEPPSQVAVPRRAASVARAISVVPERPQTVADDQVVEIEELMRSLQIAIHDAASHLPGALSAIVTAGHAVVAGGSGKDVIDKVKQALREDLDVLIVGIPGGEPLIQAAMACAPRRPVVIAACTGSATDATQRALSVGADLVTVRPHDLERLSPVLLAASRLVDERRTAARSRGSEAVLRARLDALVEPEGGTLQPFELFQRVLELELKRARRYDYAIAVALFALEIDPPPPPVGVRGILRARAGNALIHSIRDIDMATEVDHERFLVLLPYTELAGAAEVARRIIVAVADGTPVIAAGRTFPPRVIGAVAGAIPGEPLSFSRLMRDATRALEQARVDGPSSRSAAPPRGDP